LIVQSLAQLELKETKTTRLNSSKTEDWLRMITVVLARLWMKRTLTAWVSRWMLAIRFWSLMAWALFKESFRLRMIFLCRSSMEWTTTLNTTLHTNSNLTVSMEWIGTAPKWLCLPRTSTASTFV
jgi:hypothetical protein